MAIRTLTYALAAAAMTVNTSAHAAVPVRSSAPVEETEQLGGSELIPVLIFMAAILAVILFADDDDDIPVSA